jgi:hypothetical protein
MFIPSTISIGGIPTPLKNDGIIIPTIGENKFHVPKSYNVVNIRLIMCNIWLLDIFRCSSHQQPDLDPAKSIVAQPGEMPQFVRLFPMSITKIQ